MDAKYEDQLLEDFIAYARRNLLDLIESKYGQTDQWPLVRSRVLQLFGQSGLGRLTTNKPREMKMKWFKLHTDSSALSPYMSLIQDQFGLEGYARMIKLMEAIASQMLTKESAAVVEYPAKKWCQILNCKKKGLSSFFSFLHKKRIIIAKRTENGIRVQFDKLRDSLDNRAASSNLRASNGDPNQSRVDLEEKKTDNSKSDRDADCDFLLNLQKVLKKSDAKENLVHLLIDRWHGGEPIHKQKDVILEKVEKHFSNASTERAERYGSMVLSRVEKVLQIIKESSPKDSVLWPSAEAVIKVLDKGLSSLKDDDEIKKAKMKLKDRSFDEDDLFYYSYRHKVVAKVDQNWLSKFEKILLDRECDK